MVGVVKDEFGRKIIEEIVELKAKLYSYNVHQGKKERKCKGVKKSVVKKNITLVGYMKYVFSENIQMNKMDVIRSHEHEIFTENMKKILVSKYNESLSKESQIVINEAFFLFTTWLIYLKKFPFELIPLLFVNNILLDAYKMYERCENPYIEKRNLCKSTLRW